MNIQKLLLGAALALLAACTTDTAAPIQDNSPETFDKPAGGKADEVVGKLCEKLGLASDCDLCGEMEWYGDGVCDDFCSNPDPDCGAPQNTCDFNIPSELGETSNDLEDLTVETARFEAKDIDALTPIQQGQITEAMRHLEFLNEDKDFDAVFETPDDGTIDIHKLKNDDARFDWVSFFVGDTEVGVVFKEDTLDKVGEISDGDLLGCQPSQDGPDPVEPSEVACGFDTPWPVAETSNDLDDFIEAERDVTDKDIDTLSELEAQQIFQALVHTDSIDSDEGFDVVFDAVDEGFFRLIDLKADGESFDWVQFFMGDTEVGVIYAADSLLIVGEVGDGDIQGCFPTDGAE